MFLHILCNKVQQPFPLGISLFESFTGRFFFALKVFLVIGVNADLPQIQPPQIKSETDRKEGTFPSINLVFALWWAPKSILYSFYKSFYLNSLVQIWITSESQHAFIWFNLCFKTKHLMKFESLHVRQRNFSTNVPLSGNIESNENG